MTNTECKTWSMTILSKELENAWTNSKELNDAVDPTEDAAKNEMKAARAKATRHFNTINTEMKRREDEIEERKLEKEAADEKRKQEREDAAELRRQQLEDEEREERKQERKIKQELDAERSTPHGGASNAEANMRTHAIKEAVNGLTKFKAGVEPATFVRNVKNVAGQAKSEAEKEFMLMLLFNRLSPEYQTAYRNYEKTKAVNTIEEFCAHITQQYESKKALSQYFNDLYDIGRREKESLDSLAARIEENMFDGETAIRAKFVELKKKLNPEFDSELTVSDVFALMGVSSMVRALKTDKDCHMYTMTRSDECFSASDIANVAKAFTERSERDSPFMNSAEYVNHGRNEGTKFDFKTIDCFNWMGKFGTGKPCINGDTCKYKHDPEKKDKLARDKSESARTPRRGGNRGRNGGAGNGQANHTRGDNQGSEGAGTDQVNVARGGAVFRQ